MTPPPDPKPGDPVRAAHILYIKELARKAGLEVGGSLSLSAPGVVVSRIWRPTVAKLTAVHGTNAWYAWVEQVPDPDTVGDWLDGPRTGTTTLRQAIEVNGNRFTTGLPTRVDFLHTIAGISYFRRGNC